MQQPLLKIENLEVRFRTFAGTVHAINGIDLTLYPGETVGIVGESGCGKTVTASAVIGLIPSPPGEVAGGHVFFEDRDLLSLSEDELLSLRGNAISMIFQDPMTALNPVLSIETQLSEPFTHHQKLTQRQARAEALKLLELVGIPEPAVRLKQYPHQLSGGMRQRVMIAMALACKPRLLFADEPTTALDVTVQAQILDLLRALNQELNTAIVLITHDLGVVAGLCRRVLVMYAGRIVESAPVEALFASPRHPYTQGLLRSLPQTDGKSKRLTTIEGQPPQLFSLEPGCAFRPRCPHAMAQCEHTPDLFSVGEHHFSRCFLGSSAWRKR